MNDPAHETEIGEGEVAAIQEALNEMANGDRGRPFDEVMAELRAKFGFPGNRKISTREKKNGIPD